MCRVRGSCLRRSRTEEPRIVGEADVEHDGVWQVLRRGRQRSSAGRGDQAPELELARQVVEDPSERFVILDGQNDPMAGDQIARGHPRFGEEVSRQRAVWWTSAGARLHRVRRLLAARPRWVAGPSPGLGKVAQPDEGGVVLLGDRHAERAAAA